MSRVHAILDIDDETSMTIHDNHSLNKTLRNGVQLKPDVHYALEGGEEIALGEIRMRFDLVPKEEREALRRELEEERARSELGTHEDQRRGENDGGGERDAAPSEPSEPSAPETPKREGKYRD